MNSVEFQKNISYEFQNPDYLEKALTHSSFVKEKDERCGKDNERLEFLGDAFFDAVISEDLYRKLAHVSEGRLTKLRASIVCEKSLAQKAKELNLGKFLKMGKGEENTGGRERDSILADAMEAVMAAIFLDGGFEEAKKFILRTFGETIENAVSGKLSRDYKTELQESLQTNGDVKIQYQVDRQEGPDHDKTFFVSLLVEEKLLGKGVGKSKKEAEQNAARYALESGGDKCILKE
ncbi:ribonuclease III [Aminipila luticellarii]|uniref:Ribonuclease 3 n=1 Tax=Aminipila luticellarii TaxID=2507160 RepID=A0A410PU67_9FIRM|nr:ribonuclease III [Aminipila luticellarii]QAT42418.1 ribonuclease III [Aminipila luticellarii]